MAKNWSSTLDEDAPQARRKAYLDDGTYPARRQACPFSTTPPSAMKTTSGRTRISIASPMAFRTTWSAPRRCRRVVLGLAALFSVLFAAVVLGMWLSGSTGRIAAVAMCMVGVPMLVSNLRQRSERETDRHPPP